MNKSCNGTSKNKKNSKQTKGEQYIMELHNTLLSLTSKK